MWTPSALASEARSLAGRVWRLVEAQHRISTNRLVASLDDQRLLEQLAEEVKPQVPPAARRLHWLLASPFRYGHALESRFRRAHERPGIFYAAEHEATVIAEAAYWRFLFFARSPGALRPTAATEHSSFTVEVRTAAAIDLTQPPFDADRARWTHPSDYGDCQALAAAAREARVEAIRYESVRDPEHRANVALLDPAAIRSMRPSHRNSWHLKFEGDRLIAFAAFPSTERYSFTAAALGLAG